MPLSWNRRGIVKLWGLAMALVGLVALLAGSRVGRADDVVTPNGTITYTATRTLSGTNYSIDSPTFAPPSGYSMGKVAGGDYAQLTNAAPDGATPAFSPNSPSGVGVAIMFTVASVGEKYLLDVNGILTTGGKGKGGGQIKWNANEVVTPTFKIVAGTPQAKPAVVVEKEQTAVKFQVQLYNGPSSNKQPATEVTSQTYTLAPSVSGSGVKIDAVQALEGQTWTIASGGSQAIVTIHGPSKQVSFSVTATVESSKPGIMSVKLSGQVTLASGKTLSAAATPPARFSMAAVQYTEYYDNGSTALPKTEDKVVEFKRPQQGADLPADRFLKVCKIKLKKPTLVDVNITLKNPTGNLGLFKASVTGLSPTPQGSITLTLPKDGTTAKFKLSGEMASTAVNNSKVSAYLNQHNLNNGAASTHDAGDTKFTVFSFGNAKMKLHVDGVYSVSGQARAILEARPDAITMSAEADILPAKLGSDWAGNQILRHYQINLVQNCMEPDTTGGNYDLDIATASFDQGVKVGTAGYAYTTSKYSNSVPSQADDCIAQTPFYSETDHRPPVNAGGGFASDNDNPQGGGLKSLNTEPIYQKTKNGAVPIGSVYLKLSALFLRETFHDWGVVENTSTMNVNYVLKEAGWKVDFPNVKIPTVKVGKASILFVNKSLTDFPVITGATCNTQAGYSKNNIYTVGKKIKNITATAQNTPQSNPKKGK